MRTILSTIALFSLCGLCAQEYTPTYGRELPRGEILAYPSAEAATAADGGDNRYFTRLTEWNLKDNVFSTPFTVPFAWANRQVLFHLGWASGDYEVRVNGLPVACNADGNNPAEINITKQAKEGRNMLEVILAQPSSVTPLESWKEAPAPSIGGAWLMSQPTLRVRDVVTRTRMGEDGNATAEIAVAVKSEALNPRTSRIHYQLLTPTAKMPQRDRKTSPSTCAAKTRCGSWPVFPPTCCGAPNSPRSTRCGSKPSTKAATSNIWNSASASARWRCRTGGCR